ncbi:alpha/beta hydrolase [Paenibacillus sp. SYP-B3998]|uniref:Alpha/beta hydrolase n=1 Tax=Paenibacillus sp. SYP-B3998 TaxID=2678564 RepID=A0A6G3ZRS5_9BACL|nr:alpha/beta hydrolase [Paenibacillus sp. SYP-B3998]NEW04738.1 alpha/beta hydrolase [Paenibacillus sp. SYP-B3998]
MSQTSSLQSNTTSRVRTRKLRKILIGTGVLLLLLAAFVFFISYKVMDTLMHHPRDTNVSYEMNPDKTPYEKVEFKSLRNNLTIRGTFFPGSNLSDKTSDRTIIVVHGYTSNRLVKGRTRSLVEHLVPKGYNVLAFDLSSQGESDGDLITLGFNEKYDVLGAVSYLKSRGSAGDNIGVIGFSMGAATSLIAASESDDIKAVIADSPFRNAGLFLREGLSFFSGLPSFPFGWTSIWVGNWIFKVDFDSVSPMDAVKKMPNKPIMLIHGTGDPQISYKNSEIIFSSLKGNSHAEAWYPANTEHIDAINHYPTEYFQRVDRFLDKYIGSPAIEN